ncbi:MAG: hypothetical protein CVU50_09290 [Candidatus Cloacimonetes bacterium HGW-Cloacimonetes-3]|jgi:hypothetical protein|nr:MAG: hypothetical protein CVU50_09290 [Candidatus Cloacimonetes bacterium HGW-Cloacimonetes-3]
MIELILKHPFESQLKLRITDSMVSDFLLSFEMKGVVDLIVKSSDDRVKLTVYYGVSKKLSIPVSIDLEYVSYTASVEKCNLSFRTRGISDKILNLLSKRKIAVFSIEGNMIEIDILRLLKKYHSNTLTHALSRLEINELTFSPQYIDLILSLNNKENLDDKRSN